MNLFMVLRQISIYTLLASYLIGSYNLYISTCTHLNLLLSQFYKYHLIAFTNYHVSFWLFQQHLDTVRLIKYKRNETLKNSLRKSSDTYGLGGSPTTSSPPSRFCGLRWWGGEITERIFKTKRDEQLSRVEAIYIKKIFRFKKLKLVVGLQRLFPPKKKKLKIHTFPLLLLLIPNSTSFFYFLFIR